MIAEAAGALLDRRFFVGDLFLAEFIDDVLQLSIDAREAFALPAVMLFDHFLDRLGARMRRLFAHVHMVDIHFGSRQGRGYAGQNTLAVVHRDDDACFKAALRLVAPFHGGKALAVLVAQTLCYGAVGGMHHQTLAAAEVPNGAKVTAVLTQHAEDGIEDGHEVVFQTEAPKHEYRCFLEGLKTGAPIVPGPGGALDPCE